MKTQSDVPSGSKSRAVANSLSKQQHNSGTAFQFVDMEGIDQREMQGAINNSPRVQQLKSLQEIANSSPQVNQLRAYQTMVNEAIQQKESAGNHEIANAGINKNRLNSATVQLKPKNINSIHVLNVDNAGNITNAEAGRNDPPVSYPLNMAITKRVLKSKDGDAVGGHLFKREYGGADDYSNVLTWSTKTEADFTGFENRYLEQARTDGLGKGGVSREIKTEATFAGFDAQIKDISLPDKQAPDGSLIQNRTIGKELGTKEGRTANYLLTNLIRGAMESIPNSAKASSKGVESWEKSGRDNFMKMGAGIEQDQVAVRFENLLNNDAEDLAQITRAVDKVKEM